MTLRDHTDPAALRALFGIRFHHFLTVDGRLVATIATEPGDEPDTVQVAIAVCATGDAPSRFRGRQISLGRLDVGKAVSMPLVDLKPKITDRTILMDLVSDGLARRLGYSSTSDLIGDLRPRLPYTPRRPKPEGN